MKRNVWIINHYAGNMLFDKGGRHYWFAKYLKRDGYSPIVFCANSKHNACEKWINNESLWVERQSEEINIPFVYVKARVYGGNGKERVINMIDFYRNIKKAAVEYAKIHGKPDIIYASSVHPLTCVAGIQIAKKFGVKCVCEVRDLWPESIVEYNPKWKKNNPIIRILYKGEKWIYKNADAIIFTFEGGKDYILDKNWSKSVSLKKIHYINNGIDLEEFEKEKELYKVEDSDLNSEHIIKIVYTGSIRKVNELDSLLDISKRINDERVRFLIWGDGTERERLEKRVEDEKIRNVLFKGKVERHYVPFIVSAADICYAHNKATEMDRKYGISFNKIFGYLAASKPTLCDFPCKYNPVIQERAGFEVDVPSCENISSVIQHIVNLSQENYNEICENANMAAKKYDYKTLAKKLEGIIDSL